MRWRKQHPTNGEAKQAISEAQRQHRAATAHTPDVEAVAMAAAMVARRSDRLVRDILQVYRRSA